MLAFLCKAPPVYLYSLSWAIELLVNERLVIWGFDLLRDVINWIIAHPIFSPSSSETGKFITICKGESEVPTLNYYPVGQIDSNLRLFSPLEFQLKLVACPRWKKPLSLRTFFKWLKEEKALVISLVLLLGSRSIWLRGISMTSNDSLSKSSLKIPQMLPY